MPLPTSATGERWLVLIHQIPPKPDYLRVKLGRRLSRIGAVAVKNTVYVLPHSRAARDAFQAVVSEVIAVGGAAALFDAHRIDGLDEGEFESVVRNARRASRCAPAGSWRCHTAKTKLAFGGIAAHSAGFASVPTTDRV